MNRAPGEALGGTVTAWRRVLRDRALLLVGALVAAALLASSMLQGGASAALTHSVDADWRGSYDILVTSPDAVSAADGLLAPNSLRSSGESMTLEDVETIRAISGVELAAPIGEITLSGSQSGEVSLSVPLDLATTAKQSEAYRATVRLITDDGLGDRLVSETEYEIALDRSNAPRAVAGDETNLRGCEISGVLIDCALFGYTPLERTPAWAREVGSGSILQGNFSGDSVILPLTGAPNSVRRVTLVDPVAERALLGRAGSFLEPLVELSSKQQRSFEQLSGWAQGENSVAARKIVGMAEARREAQQAYLESPAYQAYLRITESSGDAAAPFQEDANRYLPLLVADDDLDALEYSAQSTALRVEIELEGFGPSPDSHGDATDFAPNPPDALRDGKAGAPLGVAAVDASALVNLSVNEGVVVPWPGTTVVEEIASRNATDVVWLPLWNAAMSTPVPGSDIARGGDGTWRGMLGAGGYRHAQDGRSSFGMPPGLSHNKSGTALGAEAAFIDLAPDSKLESGAYQEMLVSVGTFDKAQLQALSPIAHETPLGAYAPVSSQLVNDAQGNDLRDVAVAPSLSGFGIGSNRTSAIADINAAKMWAQAEVVNAVRVRAAGVERYDTAGIRSVVALAQAIEAEGFRATLVAGSSVQPIELSVGGYAFGTMDAGVDQRVGELGVIEQDWTVLGPAASLGTEMLNSTQLLLGIVMLTVLGLFAVVLFGGVGARRRESGILHVIGWSRGRIARRYVAEHVVIFMIVVGAGILAVALAADTGLTSAVVQSVLVAVGLISCVSIVLTLRRARSVVLNERQLARASAGVASRPEVRHLSGEVQSEDAQSDVARDEIRALGTLAPTPARRLLPSTPRAFGLRRAWQSRRSSALLAAGIAALTASVAALVLAVGADRFDPSFTPLGALAACGILAAGLLIARCRHHERLTKGREESLLREQGWSARELRTARLAQLLVVALPSLLLGAYVVTFGASAFGITASTTAVSLGLLVGAFAVVLMLFPRRQVGVTEPVNQLS